MDNFAPMEAEVQQVRKCLQNVFQTAADIFVDTDQRECEVKVSVDEFEGEIFRRLYGHGVTLNMVDFCDNYPFKYVFSYSIAQSVSVDS